MKSTSPNKPDASNLAIASLFHAERHWRGVADPERCHKHVTQASANKIKWTVPWEWHKHRTWVELRGVITIGAFTRVILASVVLALAICYGVEKTLGPLEFNWVRAIAISILSGIGVLLVGAAASFVPPTVQVSAKGIAVLKGQGSFMVSFADVSAIAIQESAIPVLTFRKGTREYHYAIAQPVDLAQLRQELERLSGSSVKIEKLGQLHGSREPS